MKARNRYWVGLGGNVGAVRECLTSVTREIEATLLTVVDASGIYRTPPWGPVAQADFLNQVITFESALEPLRLLAYLQDVEARFGRDRSKEIRWGARPLDLDILSWSGESLSTSELEIPHPRLSQRRFVLQPFAEISPDHRPANSPLTIKELLEQCEDTSELHCISPLS